MTKNEILDYIMSTPENTNRQVLQYLFDDISSGGGNMPLPEYECNFVDWTEGGSLVTDLDANNITEDFIFVTIHFEGEEESSNFYLIYDEDTGTGIIFDKRGISYMIDGFYLETDTDNVVFEVVEWPPESPGPEPTESYYIWDATSNTLDYSSYEYPNPQGGSYLSGYITTATYPAYAGNKDLLSYVQIEPTDNDNFNIYTDVVGVVVDNTFITIHNFYGNWNTGIIMKTQSYQYVFAFKDTPVSNSGQCKVSWYGAELKGDK